MSDLKRVLTMVKSARRSSIEKRPSFVGDWGPAAQSPPMHENLGVSQLIRLDPSGLRGSTGSVLLSSPCPLASTLVASGHVGRALRTPSLRKDIRGMPAL